MSRYDRRRDAVILVDRGGCPIPEPRREDYADDRDYLHASNAWHDRVASLASTAFDRQFRRSSRE